MIKFMYLWVPTIANLLILVLLFFLDVEKKNEVLLAQLKEEEAAALKAASPKVSPEESTAEKIVQGHAMGGSGAKESEGLKLAELDEKKLPNPDDLPDVVDPDDKQDKREE